MVVVTHNMACVLPPLATEISDGQNQVVQAADSGPGKKKGLVDSLPPGQELQADRNGALSPETIH